ncbi:MAG: DegT/DnrJ/EryC1/StrS family aminotransferase [Pseudomonadales bacterium]|nr:DegT/DnrJ/EryC1/StrS family aminotransferase [Pseudomonadales bacterium]
MQFIDLKAQYARIEGKINSRIQRVLEHGKFIMGPEVSELEEKLADYVGVKHCISCANGTDALQLALMAKGVGSGDLVFAPSFTFFATAEVISLVGATPVFVDIDEKTYNLCPQKLEQAVKDYAGSGLGTPRAIIAVDLFGQPANYPEIERVAAENSLYLIEDGAQGFGGEINGRKACSFGDVATTSFFPAKPLGCYGDGGALFTDDDELADIFKSLRVHGKGVDKYDNVRIGMNSRLDTIQAAILLEKFAIFPEEVKLRNEVASVYASRLPDGFVLPEVPEGYLSSWAQYTVRHQFLSREELMSRAKSKDIPTAVYYPKGIHQSGAFSNSGLSYVDLPVTEKMQSEVFSLPMHPYLESAVQEEILSAFN